MKILFPTARILITLTMTLAAFVLLFGGTDVSPFEFLAVVTGLVTMALIFYKRLLSSIPFSKQNILLFAFSFLVIGQLTYVTKPDYLFTITTVYLIGVYTLVQFWYKRYTWILPFAIYGYIAGVIFSSLLGTISYITAVRFTEKVVPLFWTDGIRLNGFFDDPVVYGAYLVPAILLLSYKTFFTEHIIYRLLYLLSTLLVFGNLVLSGSRGAWLNLVVAGAIFLMLYKPLHTQKILLRVGTVTFFASILAAILIFVVPLGERTYFDSTLRDRHNSSDQPRIENLQSAPNLIANRGSIEILLGSGSGSYERSSKSGFSAHNTYLRVLYEQGIVGLLFFVFFLFFVLTSLFTKRSTKPLVATILFALVCGFIVHALFVDTLHWRHFWFIIAFIL